jgi:hypothetical protein
MAASPQQLAASLVAATAVVTNPGSPAAQRSAAVAFLEAVKAGDPSAALHAAGPLVAAGQPAEVRVTALSLLHHVAAHRWAALGPGDRGALVATAVQHFREVEALAAGARAARPFFAATAAAAADALAPRAWHRCAGRPARLPPSSLRRAGAAAGALPPRLSAPLSRLSPCPRPPVAAQARGA